jgi:hypothetical protein
MLDRIECAGHSRGARLPVLMAAIKIPAKIDNAVLRNASGPVRVGATMPGHIVHMVPAGEMSSLDLETISSFGADSYTSLSRSQRLVLHKIKVEGPPPNFGCKLDAK